MVYIICFETKFYNLSVIMWDEMKLPIVSLFSITGLSQNLERLDSRKDHNRKSSESDNGEIIK